MEQEIPHFFLDFLWIAFQNGIRKLKGLLNREVAKAFGSLLFVPGTLRTQLVHDSQKAIKSSQLLGSRTQVRHGVETILSV